MAANFSFGGAVVQQQIQNRLGVFNVLVSDGSTTATLDLTTPRNAIVDQFDLVVEAARATSTVVKNVAQLRVNPAPPAELGTQAISVVIDFGALRTVSAVACPDGTSIVRIYPWTGSAFSSSPIYNATYNTGTGAVTAESKSSASQANLRSEVRTERLKIELIGDADEPELAEGMSVVLPEAPSGLELRLNGASPFWTHPAPVPPGPGTELSANSWNSGARRIVSAAAALAPLVGDPTSREILNLQFVLTVRAPGKLSLSLHQRRQRFIRRLMFGSDSSREIVYESEGLESIPIVTGPADSSHTRDIREMRLTVLGNLPPERSLPPVGPNGAGRAELVLTADRAALVRLMPGTLAPTYAGTSLPVGNFVELIAIRLPIKAGADGAEIRVALWSNREVAKGEASVDEPVEALPNAASRPVTLQAAGSEQWTTFSFDQPVPFDPGNSPWAALLVSRGSISWELGETTGASDGIHPCVLRTGPAAGPWQALPGPLTSDQPGIGSSRGRVRLAGHGAKEKPIAPIVLGLTGSAGSFEVTPSEKGTALLLTVSPAVNEFTSALEITSRAGGAVTLRDIDVISGT